MTPESSADLILHRGLFTTLDRANPTASAVAIKDGVFTAVGRDADIMPLASRDTRIVWPVICRTLKPTKYATG